MKLPSRIRIGPFDYSLGRFEDETDDFGECDTTNHKIVLAQEFSSSAVEAETLWHEVTHAIWNHGGLEDGDKEERIVHTLSIGFITFMRDNKDLIRSILKALK